MFKKFFLPAILLILVYGFWVSPEFKEISAGVAIFLFGMMFLEQGFKAFTGGTLEKILQVSTNRTWKSLLFGFSSATIMQSSSLVSLLAISFLSAELITLVQGVGIIFGANIGTTTGAWLIAAFGMKINISLYAMPMLVFGVILSFQKTKVLKGFGSILAGLGFLFLGIHYMKEGFEAFQNSIQLIDYAIEGFLGILAFAGIGILATIIMQSSHATIILVIAALATGQVTYENALALIIGANVGTTITAILGSLTSNINGKRLAMSDVLFKSTTGVIFIILMPFISDLVNILAQFIGIASDNYTLKLALFHTLFNLVGLAIVIPFMPVLIQTVTRIFPDKKERSTNTSLYINDSVINFPDTAIVSIIKETRHLYNQATDVILNSLGLTIEEVIHSTNKKELIKKVKILETEEIQKLYDIKIKTLYAEILEFISNTQSVNEKKYYDCFYRLKEINIKIIENIEIINSLHKNFTLYNKSSNIFIKEEYDSIIFEIITLIDEMNSFNSITGETSKLLFISEVEMGIEKNEGTVNGKIDELIREQSITSYMASTLINDVYYKNEFFANIFDISDIVFSNKITDEISDVDDLIEKNLDFWFNNMFGLSEKKVGKIHKKLINKKAKLKSKLHAIKDADIIADIKKQIKIIDFALTKYK